MNREELIEKVRKDSEECFRSGDFFCSEAIVWTLNEVMDHPMPEEVVRMASSFPVGLGKAQCLCGAVSGGEMILGMVYGRVRGEKMNPKMFEYSKALHDFIKEKYKSTCCRVITRQWAGDNFASPERKAHCINITGEVAAWVCEKLIDDGKIEVK